MVVYDIQILYPIPTYVNTTKINPLYKTLFWTFVSETAILATNGTILEHEYLFMQPVADRGIFKKSENLEKKQKNKIALRSKMRYSLRLREQRETKGGSQDSQVSFWEQRAPKCSLIYFLAI